MHETLDELLRRQPFQPFVVLLSNGNSHPVRHPELASLFKTKIVIGIPETDEIVVCFLLHVAEVRLVAKT